MISWCITSWMDVMMIPWIPDFPASPSLKLEVEEDFIGGRARFDTKFLIECRPFILKAILHLPNTNPTLKCRNTSLEIQPINWTNCEEWNGVACKVRISQKLYPKSVRIQEPTLLPSGNCGLGYVSNPDWCCHPATKLLKATWIDNPVRKSNGSPNEDCQSRFFLANMLP